MLQREDPSLKVRYDEETGQTIVSGMGELHLEIILERIRSEYGVDASLGALQVAYKETVLEDVCDTFVLDKMLGMLSCIFRNFTFNTNVKNAFSFPNIAGSKQYVKLTMSIKSDPLVPGVVTLELASSKEEREQLSLVWPVHMKAAQRGVSSALSAGPLLSFPVYHIQRFSNIQFAKILVTRSQVFGYTYIRWKLDHGHRNSWWRRPPLNVFPKYNL